MVFVEMTLNTGLNLNSLMLNHFLKSNMWKNNNHFLTTQSFLSKFSMTRLRHVSAYYQVMFKVIVKASDT